MQLFVDGLKLQPALPTFVDYRDAVLLADEVNSGGANQLAIWTAFARRGIGFSADDGGSANAQRVTEAFRPAPPSFCNWAHRLKSSKTMPKRLSA